MNENNGNNYGQKLCFDQHLKVDLSNRKLSLSNESRVIFNADIGIKIPPNVNYNVERRSDDNIDITWIGGFSHLTINRNLSLSDSTVIVYDISWTTDTTDELSDAFEMSPHHWYGGPEMFKQKWPFEKNQHDMWSYTTSDIYKPGYGNVMERYWLLSSHVAITIDDNVPLLISINEGGDDRLRLLSKYGSTLYSNFVVDEAPPRPFLKYKLWMAVDDNRQGRQTLRDFHLNVVNKYFGESIGDVIPDRKMFESPIWTTWARYKHAIDQEKVMKFADEIIQHEFPRSQIEIDDVWETKYGDLTFDPIKFPDARRMVEELHAKGFRVTVWVHPFVGLDSVTAKNHLNENYWVQGADGRPAKVEWWNGQGYMLDTTNDDAVHWFVERLNEFKIFYDVDSFKFDAGETNWLPDYFKLKNAAHPNQYTTNYANMAARFGPLIEARCNSRNQNAPNFLRIMDKDSNWTDENGLKTLIPVSLLFGVLGRPFVLPDIIGGNAYHDSKPDQELYIRWTQANVFLPSMQFSIPPWDFDDDCVKIVRRSIELHEKYSSTIIDLAEKSNGDGSPIVRPLWWTGDESEDALICDDQFMLGDDIMVAPVLDPGVTGTTVYLPRGDFRWYSVLDGKLYDGGERIFQNATLDQLPHYIKRQ